MAANIIFITGTDTGVGKTTLAVVLTRLLRAQGLRVAALKPICSGGRADARALHRAAPFLRRQLGARLRLKRAPELRFQYDDSVAGQDRIEQLLNEIHAEQAARQSSEDDDPQS